jgi:hypothetical protein
MLHGPSDAHVGVKREPRWRVWRVWRAGRPSQADGSCNTLRRAQRCICAPSTAPANDAMTSTNNNNQAAPDCWPCRAQSYAVLAYMLRVSGEAVQHQHTCTPNNPHAHAHAHAHPPAGPVRHPTASRAAHPRHVHVCVAQLSAPEFTAPVASYRPAQLVHGASYSVLPWPRASSVGNIPCLARLSRGIGSAIPANTTCCSSCSSPDTCELEPASRLLPSATRPSSSYQVSHAACILHLAS